MCRKKIKGALLLHDGEGMHMDLVCCKKIKGASLSHNDEGMHMNKHFLDCAQKVRSKPGAGII